MERKYSVITGFMGQIRDRFVEYQPPREIEEMLEMISRIKGCKGIEAVYPQNFQDAEKLKKMLNDYHLDTAAVNLNIKGEPRWRFGTYSSPDPATRRQAVDILKDAMDCAALLGCNLVQTALLNDGSDYAFELDYARAFQDAADAISEASSYRADVRISLEYKLSEPRVHCLFNNAGKMAAFCQYINRPNVGITLDVGHALQAMEVPADSVSFLSVIGRLFYIHVNDNTRIWDWDMIPGTVNFWDYLEFLYSLEKVGYSGWLTADVFPQRYDPVKTFEKTFEWLDYMLDIVERLDKKILNDLMNKQDTYAILDYIRGSCTEKVIMKQICK